MTLTANDPLTYWQVTPLNEALYDVADAPMEGEMDSTFFLTKDKNIIPHTYPCRTAYIAEARDKEPRPQGAPDWSLARNVLPMGSPKLDLSGFWFRATRVSGWARTAIDADADGTARLSLSVCGAAVAFVNGEKVGWLAPATRNATAEVTFDAPLKAGKNEITIYFDDLAERDAVIPISLVWLSGPTSKQGLPFNADPQLVRGVEATFEAMHLDRNNYDDAEIWLQLPVAFSVDTQLSVRVAGHFMSHDQQVFSLEVPAGQGRVLLCHSSDLPADYRYFHIAVSVDDFVTQATLGAEISHRSALPPPADTLDARIEEALAWVAENAETDTERAVACLARGTEADLETASAIITHALPAIENCWDCADFALVPLLWGRIIHPERLSSALRERVDQAILTYRYWMDEPGNDVQWYFSENHALLFHTAAYLGGNLLPDATFQRSGRKGTEQRDVNRDRLMAWFDHFESVEMAEFNSAPYFPIDLKGMTALFALAPDQDIRARAQKAIARLIELVANSAHHGVITAAQGRSYQHSLCVTDTLELTGISRLLWGKGAYGAHVNCLPQLALCLRDYGLKLPDLTGRACWAANDAQEWMYCQGQNAFAHLYHYKTADTAMGSAATYRWGEWGYQETLIHARLGHDPRAQVWVNHPGELIQSGYGRPSYWGGSASVPRVQQYRDLAVVLFSGQAPQPNFTHCWFPTACFDQWRLSGNRASAVSGNGMITLSASGPLELQEQGASAGNELRLDGHDGLWVLRLGQGHDLDGFEARHSLSVDRANDGTLHINDPEYGLVTFHPDGRVEAEGRVLNPKGWSLSGTRTILPLQSDKERRVG
ncbi:hypothetical protein [Actibacterium lipolyticum]|uniref:Uncharacterized protein n=1 Tax=Actibacterium lipolyticum TaxID=1524263 RepID=A0A238L7Z8_9RHOB|nr:hypothetical protein [Actibacterium lipolyticum]SMX51109.1 hypothetical protein COL8621_03639 [Actibacterium lipolyticum]